MPQGRNRQTDPEPSDMFDDKELIAKAIQTLVRKAEALPELAQQLQAFASQILQSHRRDCDHTEIANQGTVECPACQGARVQYAGPDARYVQCSTCRGWGRLPLEPAP